MFLRSFVIVLYCPLGLNRSLCQFCAVLLPFATTCGEIAKAIVDGIGKDLAAGLVEYYNLVKQLAEDIPGYKLRDSGLLPPWPFTLHQFSF